MRGPQLDHPADQPADQPSPTGGPADGPGLSFDAWLTTQQPPSMLVPRAEYAEGLAGARAAKWAHENRRGFSRRTGQRMNRLRRKGAR